MTWREITIRSHERADGATVKHVILEELSTNGFDWLGFGPAPMREPLLDPKGRVRRFLSARIAKAAVDKAWPEKRT